MDDKEKRGEEKDQTLDEASQSSEPEQEVQTQTPPETEPEEDQYPDKNPYINTTSPYTTQGMPSKKRNPKKLILIALGLIILLLLLNFARGALFKSSKAIPTPTPAPVSVETPLPSPSSSPSVSPAASPKTASSIDSATGLDRAKLSIAIQNGSGESGVAAKASAFLTGLGYNVVSTGNADNYNYTGVTVKVKSSKSDFLSLLKKDLGTSYTVSSATSDFSASSSADALVIIGK